VEALRRHAAITDEAGAGEKTSETVIQKIFDELPGPGANEELNIRRIWTRECPHFSLAE
jgi:hypothetical protein